MVAESPARTKSLEALRITRPKEKPRRRRTPGVLLAIIILVTAVGAPTAYEVYSRTVGRPQTVQTIMVVSNRGGQPGVMLTGSGYVVTRHKYITVLPAFVWVRSLRPWGMVDRSPLHCDANC